MPTYSDPRFVPFLDAMREAPGSSTHLFVAADWLDEDDQPALAAAVRTRAPLLAERYQRVSETLDAMLAFDLSRAKPVPMPEPDRGHYRSRQQWVRLVRIALRPFRIPHLTVGAADGWHGGPDVELRVPPLELGIGDGRGTGFRVPWGVTTFELIRAGTLAFGELMPRLFPDEPARVVHFDGESTTCAFWRVTARNR
jgi:uncharacterized protein (TIGR02996 family)